MEKNEKPVLVAVIGTLGAIIVALISNGYLRSNSAAKRQDTLEAQMRELKAEAEKKDETIAGLQKKIADGTKTLPQTPSAPSSSEQSKSVNNFLVNLDGCERANDSLICRFTVINQRSDADFRLFVSDISYSVIFDSQGREYRPSDGQFAEFTNGHMILKRLITGIPVKGSLTFVGVPKEITSLAVLDILCDTGDNLKTVEFRNVVIKD